MELRHLQALVAVAEQGSFSAAADHLGTVQSNVSAHVARLERELSVTLVDRSAGRLTEEGELAVARAYRVISELEALATDVGALRADVTGTVRVGMIGTTARWLLPALLSDLALTHPKLKLVVTEAPTSGLEPLLAAGRLDLAVLTHPVPGRDLISEPLFEEDILLVTKTEIDPTGGRQSIDISDLAEIDLMLPAPGTAFRSEVDSATKPAGVRLRPAIEVDGVRLLASLTFDGYGPALLPSTAVPEFLRSSVRLVTIEGMASRHVGMATRSRGLPSAPARAVMSALRSRASDPDRLPEGLRPAHRVRQTASEGAPRVVGPPNG
ncbi:MAG: LysR family transcriptional regulator [Acidimicrobiales bacterium]